MAEIAGRCKFLGGAEAYHVGCEIWSALNFPDIVTEWAALEHEFGNDANTATHANHGQNSLVSRHLSIDVGFDVVLF